ncbi:MAG: hypothetical protein QM632_02845 [Micrococcaceae bacterium]
MEILEHPAARAEYKEAVAYYNADGYDVGLAFYRQMEKAKLDVIGPPTNLRQYKEFAGVMVYQKSLKNYPYSIFFTFEESMTIYAYAGEHMKPDYWKNRLHKDL